MSCKLYNVRIRVASRFWQRFKGLMFAAPLAADQALLITPCPSVHTFFMREPIDLVYLDRNARAVKLVEAVPPWRFSTGGRGAYQVLEMQSGAIARLAIKAGHSFAEDLACAKVANVSKQKQT